MTTKSRESSEERPKMTSQQLELRWDDLFTSQRIAIANAIERKLIADGQRLHAPLRHKLTFGTWESLGKKTQTLAHSVSWSNAIAEVAA